MIDLSVVIPTRDRSNYLRDALRTLNEQDVPAGSIEVIVVDDGSVDETPGVAESLGARVIRQEPQGLNAGRNAGSAVARGRILAFLDDDVLVPTEWARELIDVFNNSGCHAAGGKVLLEFESSRPAWLSPAMYLWFSGLDYGDQARPMKGVEVPYGVNCSVTKKVFEDSGGFIAGLDREGDSLLSAGDAEFFRRLQREGYVVWYAPLAYVRHRVPERRLNRKWILDRAWWGGVSDAKVDRIRGIKGSVSYEMFRGSRALLILAKSLLLGRGTLPSRLWLNYHLGKAQAIRRGMA